MAATRRPFGPVVESKKYDTALRNPPTGGGLSLRFLRSFRRRRLLLGLLAVWLVYIFFRNIPTDLPPLSERYDKRYGALRPTRRPHGSDETAKAHPPPQTYMGPIQFHNLAATLRGSGFTQEAKGHVLFALSNLKSASSVVVAACGMVQQNRTIVHVAYMGRQELEVKHVLSVNGLSESDCPVRWHDARPDFAFESAEERMEHSVGAALGRMQTALRLQATFFDDAGREDDFFMSSMRVKTEALGIPFIPVPTNQRDQVPWLLSLDGPALKMWGRVQVDIIIRAIPESSGSLLHLLRSIKEADYTGLSHPRLIVELPSNPDPFLLDSLSRFEWPPGTSAANSKLMIRRRIYSRHRSVASATLQTVESFYPASTTTSHVLMISSNAEVSSDYYQFLMFTMFEFKYGVKMAPLSRQLLGISLSTPTDNRSSKTGGAMAKAGLSMSPLLWQAPAADAALYFGDKWIEMHEFLTSRLAADRDLLQAVPKAPVMSERHPAWLRMTLEMMQAQGYYMLYPGHRSTTSSWVTIHTELREGSEEYVGLSTTKLGTSESTGEGPIRDGGLLTASAPVGVKETVTPMVPASSFASALGMGDNAYGGEGLWPGVYDLPLYPYNGKNISWTDFQSQASIYAETFALSVGGCTSPEERPKAKTGLVGSLFCRSEPAVGG